MDLIRRENRPSSRLKWLNSLYRPTWPEEAAPDRKSGAFRMALLGRSQAVRQRILIPPFGGSIPPAPAIDFKRELAFW
jgi:hypothetical protein